MPASDRRSHGFPLPGMAVVLVCLAYAFFGVLDHDPWKNADAVTLNLAQSFSTLEWRAENFEQWLVPRLAGEPFPTPPLYLWVAAMLGDGFCVWMPWHSAARLATPLFTLLGLLGISLAARGLHGREAGMVAPLLALGSLGLVVPAHEAQAAMVGFAALAGVLAALAWWTLYPRRAAFGLGLSLGGGFLGSGVDTTLIALIVIATALLYPSWRRVARAAWVVALAIALGIALPWLAGMSGYAPEALGPWWSGEVTGLFWSGGLPAHRIDLLLWGTWPVLPLAAWTVWLHRRKLLLGRHALPLVASAASLLLFVGAGEANESIPAVVATLAVLGSGGVAQLRRGAASAFDWFGTLTLSLVMGLIWLGGIAILTGEPARIAKNFSKPAPLFQADFSPLAIAVALAATLVWLLVVVTGARSPWRPALRWALGIACSWVLVVCLLLPWIDYGKTYRPVALALAAQVSVPGKTGCIARLNLGTGQRASLDYFAGLRTIASDDEAAEACRYLLVQTDPASDSAIPGWTLLSENSRPGDRRERLRLYQRTRDGY